jgi:gentisate 1,2-dioxygenase
MNETSAPRPLATSSIAASEADLRAYWESLRPYRVEAPWARPAGEQSEPGTLDPAVWHWQDLRAPLLRSAELVGTKQVERRILRLVQGTRLSSNLQLVMPGEIARAHRHTMAALRMIIESEGAYTVVEGDQVPMAPGDLVSTPNWTWHDHANVTNQPAIWLDGLDAPLVGLMKATFQEEYPEESQRPKEDVDVALAKYGTGGLVPAWEQWDKPYSPLFHYPWSKAKAALDEIARVDAGSAFDGVILQYTNPVNGGPVMPTIACYCQLLRPGQHTRAHRHTSSSIYHVIEGEGFSLVDGVRLDWETKATMCVPSWTSHEHVNTSTTQPAYLFSYTDDPVYRTLQLYREEAVSG